MATCVGQRGLWEERIGLINWKYAGDWRSRRIINTINVIILIRVCFLVHIWEQRSTSLPALPDMRIWALFRSFFHYSFRFKITGDLLSVNQITIRLCETTHHRVTIDELSSQSEHGGKYMYLSDRRKWICLHRSYWMEHHTLTIILIIIVMIVKNKCKIVYCLQAPCFNTALQY